MAQMLRFQRPLGERRYKKLFVVSVEGSKTEPQYFAIFNQPQSIVLVKCLNRPSTESSPIHVLKKMQGYLRKESLELINKAIARAKQRDVNRFNDLPSIWSTTVYKLIERIIEHN